MSPNPSGTPEKAGDLRVFGMLWQSGLNFPSLDTNAKAESPFAFGQW
jgi:hypothetical protein